MKTLLISPIRNLLGGVLFVLVVCALAVLGYMSQGWSTGDALYMVVLTVFTVGYDEVHPINTVPLRAITMGLIVAGCTGMIFLTGALVQFITFSGLQQILSHKYMTRQIEQLRDHVIVCGFGRTGTMLARELKAAGASFIVLERNLEWFKEARALGYLCLHVSDPIQRGGSVVTGGSVGTGTSVVAGERSGAPGLRRTRPAFSGPSRDFARDGPIDPRV